MVSRRRGRKDRARSSRAHRRALAAAGGRGRQYVNLALFVVALILVLLGIRTAGDPAASCFVQLGGPEPETAPAGEDRADDGPPGTAPDDMPPGGDTP